MRYLVKTALGSKVLERQENIGVPQSKKEANDRWHEFGKKSTVRNKILAQQLGLCGYTEFQINEFCSISGSDAKQGCHIEHVKLKSEYPQQTFDYFNLIISVLSDADLKYFKMGKFGDVRYFGGHHKDRDNDFSAVNFISPLDQDCSHYFQFIEDSGEVVPAVLLDEIESQKAKYTIELLNLNHSFLKNQRKKRMAEVAEDIDGLKDRDKLNEIRNYELGVHGDKLFSFPSAVASIF